MIPLPLNKDVEKNIVYSTGPLEDGVLFVSVPYDIYRYTIVQDPDAARVGQIEEIRLPRQRENDSEAAA